MRQVREYNTARSVVDIDAYAGKNDQYFSGARHDWIARLPENASATILEVGCGNGDTGEAALHAGVCGQYFGVELMPNAADEARSKLTDVYCGDIESIELPIEDGSLDVIFMSEVLEHLVDPWAVVQRMQRLLRPGGRCFASSPNIAHYGVLRMLSRGEWNLSDSGAMDRTHLRWFTPRSYVNLFRDAGLDVIRLRPVAAPGPKAAMAMRVLPKSFHHLLWRQIDCESMRAA
ncbi:MAG: methyltransferase domain-containing protein [Planctomycetota bacterium]